MRPSFRVLFGLLARHAVGLTTLILDNYTGADGTTNSGRAPSPTNTPGGTYTVGNGSSTITTNAAVFGAGSSRIFIESGVANCRLYINGKMGTASTRTPRLFFRDAGHVGTLGNGSANLWFIEAVQGAGGSWNINEDTAGTTVTRATVSVAINASQTYLIEVRLSGSTIELWVDNALVTSYTSSVGSTRTKHGIGCNAATGVTVDDFQVAA